MGFGEIGYSISIGVKPVTLISLTLCGVAFAQAFATGSHHVSSYTRRDGTYVREHEANNHSTGSTSTSRGPELWPLLFFGVGGIGFIAWLVKKTSGGATTKSPPLTMERQAAEIIMLFRQADSNRGFTPVPSDLQLANDEICVFRDQAGLREMRPHRYAVGGAVRVMRGVYVGGRQYESKESFDVVDAGNLSVTNKRLVFTGVKTTINTAFKDIVSLDRHTDGLFLHSAKRQKASFFEFSRPLMVQILVRFFQANPDGAQPLRDNEEITAGYNAETKQLTVGRHDKKAEPPPLPAPCQEPVVALPPARNGVESVPEATGESAGQERQTEAAANLYVFMNDAVQGPFSLEQLTDLLGKNTVNPSTPCCEGGAEEWKTVADYVVAPT